MENLIELISAIWDADTAMRDQSLVGESPMDRRSRRTVAIICGGLIGLLLFAVVAAGVLWWWVVRA